MAEKTRALLRYEVAVCEVKEALNEETGEWNRVTLSTNIVYEKSFATVYLVEGTPVLDLGDKVLDLAKACARGYLKGVECPKWEVPE